MLNRSSRYFDTIQDDFKYASLIVSIGLFTISALTFLALISDLFGSQLIGTAGSSIATGLNYVFGVTLSFGVPLFCCSVSFVLWPRRIPKKFPLIAEGLFICMISLTGLLAVGAANQSPSESLARAGAIGTFLMHQDACNLTLYLGQVGTYLTFCSLLLVGIIVTTNRNPVESIKNIISAFKISDFLVRIKAVFFEPVLENKNAPSDDTDDEDDHLFESSPQKTYQKDFGRTTGRLFRATSPTLTNPPEPTLNFSAMDFSDQNSVLPVDGFLIEDNGSLPQTTDRFDSSFEAIDQPVIISKQEFQETQFDETSQISKHPTSQDLITSPPPSSELRATKTSDFPDAIPVTPFIDIYDLPETSLLNRPPRIDMSVNQDEARRGAEAIICTLDNFGVQVNVTNIVMGPSVTRYELQPAPGVKIERVTALENNLTMAMEAKHLRIIAPIPGKAAIGIEVPNKNVQPVFLSELLNCESFRASTAPLAFALGKTIDGQPRVLDLARMPHLLIAGTTGSGKSVCLNCVIVSILFHMPPSRVKIIMIDPKQVELSVYRDIPHLIAPVVTHPQNAAAALSWACEEMEERLYKMSQVGVRNIDGYNSYVNSQSTTSDKRESMPHIVVIIDELADLMLVAKKDVEDSIIRLAQKARAAGIHLILATQRPTVNVITGLIKSNFPARIAFQVASHIDSRTILDAKGAEALQGKGDMLFSTPGSLKPERIQGCYVSDAEVEAVAEFVRLQAKPQYRRDVLGEDEDDDISGDTSSPWDEERYQPATNSSRNNNGKRTRFPSSNGNSIINNMSDDDKSLYEESVKLVLTSKMASQSMLQRRLRIGFSKAGWLMDQMETEGIVGPSQNGRPRDILVDPDEYLYQRGWLEMQGD